MNSIIEHTSENNTSINIPLDPNYYSPTEDNNEELSPLKMREIEPIYS